MHNLILLSILIIIIVKMYFVNAVYKYLLLYSIRFLISLRFLKSRIERILYCRQQSRQTEISPFLVRRILIGA